MNHRITFLVAAALMLAAATASAHHNMSAIYDFNDKVTMTGTLSKIDWRNPHIELIVETKDGAQVQNWSLEGPSPGFFRERDINRADVEAALRALEAAIKDAQKAGLLRLAYEGTLVWSNVQIKSGNAAEGRARLASLQKEALAKNYLLVARKAAKAQ